MLTGPKFQFCLYFLFGYLSCFVIIYSYTKTFNGLTQVVTSNSENVAAMAITRLGIINNGGNIEKDNLTIETKFNSHYVSSGRVLVWVMTHPDNLKKKAVHVNSTWGKHADKILFASDKYDPNFPTIPISIPEGREHLTAKTMKTFDYIYNNYLDDFSWFMKADDDTYVIIENLKYFLSDKNASAPVYYGHLFVPIVKGGYHSGGAGYVLSREALKRFGERPATLCANDSSAEDVQIGRCLSKLGVEAREALDQHGRTRFHCFKLDNHMSGKYPEWYMRYDKNKGLKYGIYNISEFPITFHYVLPTQMYELEYYTYHLHKVAVTNKTPRMFK